MNILELEQPEGVIASLGGQTAINLAGPLTRRGVQIIGTDCDAIEKAENRDAFEKVLEQLHIPQPRGQAVTNIEDGVRVAAEIGYPVLVRPSYVLGGRAMQIVAQRGGAAHVPQKRGGDQTRTSRCWSISTSRGKELEVDAVCDGTRRVRPRHHGAGGAHGHPLRRLHQRLSDVLRLPDGQGHDPGIHDASWGWASASSGCTTSSSSWTRTKTSTSSRSTRASSRTVPFLSKATGYSLADIATLRHPRQVAQGAGPLRDVSAGGKYWYVKVPAFSFSKLVRLDTYLSPEMKSTGEAIGYDSSLTRALYKALIASGMKLANYGTLFVTIADGDKEEALPLIRRFYNMGFNIEATRGTARFLKEHGIRTRTKRKLSDGSDEILEGIRKGYVTYIINTREYDDSNEVSDGYQIRRCASENNVTVFTALDTVRVLLDVLEETTMTISTIDAAGR